MVTSQVATKISKIKTRRAALKCGIKFPASLSVSTVQQISWQFA